MPPLISLLPTLLLTLFATAISHAPGQQYTYLSMFLTPHSTASSTENAQRFIHSLGDSPSHFPQITTRRLRKDNSEASSAAWQDGGKARVPVVVGPGFGDEQDDEDTSTDVQQNPTQSPSSYPDPEPPHDTGEADEAEEEEQHDSEEKIKEQNVPPSIVRVLDSHNEDQYAEPQVGMGEDLERLSMMLLKIIRENKLHSMIDVPCRAHGHWMPAVLQKIAKHDPHFRYTCVDTSDDVLERIKRRVGLLVNARFVRRRFWTEGLPKADFVFSWSGLDNMKQHNVLKYLQKLAKSGKKHKFIMLGSHSGTLKKHGSKELISRFTSGGTPINLRRPPFQLKKPSRIISKLATEQNDKQLYIYKAKDML